MYREKDKNMSSLERVSDYRRFDLETFHYTYEHVHMGMCVHTYIHMSDVHSITMSYVHACIQKDECHLIEQTATRIGAEHNNHTHTLVDSEWYLSMSKGREFSCTTHTLYKTRNNPCTGVDGETLDHAHINTVSTVC